MKHTMSDSLISLKNKVSLVRSSYFLFETVVSIFQLMMDNIWPKHVLLRSFFSDFLQIRYVMKFKEEHFGIFY